MPSVKQEAAEQAPASEKEASQLAPGAEGSEGASDTGASQALAGATTASAGSGEELPEDSDSEVSSASVCSREAMTIFAGPAACSWPFPPHSGQTMSGL